MSDDELIGDGGKENAFIKLLVSAQPRIFGYIVTLMSSLNDAEEIMQETSIVMWNKFDDFASAKKASEKSVEDLVAWGNQIAYYKVMNLRRRKKLNATQLSDNVIQMISDEWVRQEQSRTLEDRRQALKKCIDLLSPTQRELLEEYYWQRTTIHNIAERSQRSTASIYKVLQRIRDALHKCISNRLVQET